MSVQSNIKGFRWEFVRHNRDHELAVVLTAPSAKRAATVWLKPSLGKYVWHVWDENGIGGENSSESSIEFAMYEAEQATVRWGKHACKHDRLNEDGICRVCGDDCRGIH